MVKWLLVLWGFSGFSGFLMVLMVWNVIPGRQSIRGGSDNDLPPSSPVCKCKRETKGEIVRQYMYSKCVIVCVCNDVDGQNIVQTDNESCESTIKGHYRKTKPNLSIRWVTSLVASISLQPVFIYIYVYTLKTQITFIYM